MISRNKIQLAMIQRIFKGTYPAALQMKRMFKRVLSLEHRMERCTGDLQCKLSKVRLELF